MNVKKEKANEDWTAKLPEENGRSHWFFCKGFYDSLSHPDAFQRAYYTRLDFDGNNNTGKYKMINIYNTQI